MNKIKLLGVSASVLLAASAVTAKQAPIAKHLAGPAEEIELLQKSHPEQAAIVSKHAMLAIDLQPDATGEYSWRKQVLIDGENPQVLLFSSAKDDWELEIKGINSQKRGGAEPINFYTQETSFGMAAARYPATQFDLQNLKSGRYQFGIQASAQHNTPGYLLVSSDSPYRLKSYVSSPGQLVGDMININASALTADDEFTVVKQDLQLIQSSYLRITAPDGSVAETMMFDDGMAADKLAADGEFNGRFRAEQAGVYQVQVVAQGITPKGMPFLRTVEHMIPVVASDLVLSSKQATGQYTSAHKIDLSFAVDTALPNTQFRVLAEVWGSQEKSSELTPVSWLSTMVDASSGQIKLQLDDRWLLAKGVQAPYELKNIRIEDTAHYISLLQVDRLALDLPAVSQATKSSYDGGLYESMLKGDKPAALKNVDKAAGGKLMLVHGYCSGDAWGPVQSQFSNSVKFTDFNQNRSHDAFARLIDTFGDNYPSFGVVAHSQGGAASLHLYTYYWSGLDNAGSGRLIQSVGTPYQGTPLAGNLAAIGNIFGAGCGYNSNLTTSGASSWLAGIPTWARNKVNYYTTSFTDKWWRPDWCNIATDIFLSDPDDGVIERSRGQLSGASNRGHKTGQCHTTGMRDMAQTRDSGRNSTMSNNAAR